MRPYGCSRRDFPIFIRTRAVRVFVCFLRELLYGSLPVSHGCCDTGETCVLTGARYGTVRFLYGRAQYGWLFAFYGSSCTGVRRFPTVFAIRELVEFIRVLDTGLSGGFTDAHRTGVCLLLTGSIVREFAGFSRLFRYGR